MSEVLMTQLRDSAKLERALRADVIRQQIDSLLRQVPELAEDEILRADMIEAETDAVEFLRKTERKRQETCALTGAIAANIAELDLRLRRFERREQSLRKLMFILLETADLDRLELPEATLSLCKIAPKVVITNEEWLPDIACKMTRSPDKTKIKELLKDGPVAGAAMSNGGLTISIRTK